MDGDTLGRWHTTFRCVTNDLFDTGWLFHPCWLLFGDKHNNSIAFLLYGLYLTSIYVDIWHSRFRFDQIQEVKVKEIKASPL